MSKAVRIACKGSARKELDDLEPFQGNLKKLSELDGVKLRKEILELGFSEPISIWQHAGKNFILNGHQRLAVLKGLRDEGYSIPPLPVSLVEADSCAQAKRKVLALTSQYGEITQDGLVEFLQNADISLEEAVESFRFPELDLQELLSVEADIEQDEVPGLSEEAVARPGEIYELGSHRLMCGDSTQGDDIALLMQGTKARLMATDPPYGVAYDGSGSNPKWRKDGATIANDDLGVNQEDFWVSAFKLWPLEGDAYVFCPSGPPNMTLARAIEAAGIEHHQWLVWVKDRLVLGRSHYHYRHEHIFYGWKGKSSWAAGRDQDSVWECERPSSSPEHPTMKPVPLVARAIANSSAIGDVVVDGFLGSGTTLIAAQQMGRRCYGMEIKPCYVDVAIRRYYELLGWDKAPKKYRRWLIEEIKE